MRAVIISVAVFATFACGPRRHTPGDVRSCVRQIFSDPDAYDPGAWFTINPESTLPNEDAANWVNEALSDCLEGNDL
jgi:hypothetical protein